MTWFCVAEGIVVEVRGDTISVNKVPEQKTPESPPKLVYIDRDFPNGPKQ